MHAGRIPKGKENNYHDFQKHAPLMCIYLFLLACSHAIAMINYYEI